MSYRREFIWNVSMEYIRDIYIYIHAIYRTYKYVYVYIYMVLKTTCQLRVGTIHNRSSPS